MTSTQVHLTSAQVHLVPAIMSANQSWLHISRNSTIFEAIFNLGMKQDIRSHLSERESNSASARLQKSFEELI